MAIDLFDEEVKSDYITIGGKQRPTHNSNGDLIYPTVQGIVNFYKWFGNSKVVDSQGRPLVVYHGSGTKELFDIFNNGQGRAGSQLYVGAYWFTDNYEMAQSYANVYERDYVTGYQSDKIIDKNPIYAGYLRIVKPFVVDFEGANWDGDAIGKVSLYQIVFGQKQLIRKSKTQTFFDSYEEAYLRAQQMGLPEDKYEIYTDSVRPEGATDEIIHQQLEKRIKKKVIKYVGQEVVRAFKNKNASDGAIFQNIVDYGHIDDDKDVTTMPTGTDFVIYSPNQFKSINNSGYFTRSNNMNESFEKQIMENTGVSLPNENSLGEKIIPDDDPVKLQNFWNWFNGSKIITRSGKPLVVYHGSNAEFSLFDKERVKGKGSYWSDGFYFTTYNKPNEKDEYNRGASHYGKIVYAVYLSIKNPFIIKNYKDGQRLEELLVVDSGLNKTDKFGDSWAKFVLGYRSELTQEEIRARLLNAGYDGIINASLYSKNEVYIIAFEPNQIKSINNNGEFSMSSDNIYETFEMNKILENAGVLTINEARKKSIKTPIIAYHGSYNEFDKFSNEFINTNKHKENFQAFWFCDNKEVVEQYGSIIYTCELNVSKLFDVDTDLTSKIIKMFNKKYPNASFDLENQYAKQTHRFLQDLGYQGIMFNNGEGNIYCIYDSENIKILNKEEIEEVYESRVNKNLKESLEFHSKLNNKIWNGFKLKEKVHDALYKIADVFTRSLEVPNLELEDVVITGSLCNYNYNKNSDIDLHLVVDFEKLGITPEDFVQKYFNAKKTEFNTKHDIKVYGYPVELYVEDVKSPARATGRYSLLDNQWINTPKGMKDEVVDISDNKKYKEFVDKIDSLEDDDASLEHASDLLSEIYDMRANGLEKDGELSEDNLVFKELRNGGYLDKLREYMIDTMDDELSLTESLRMGKYNY